MELLIHFLFSLIATITFAVLTNVPKRALLACGLTGALGWLTFWLLKDLSTGPTFANFLGAGVIGITSVFFSRKLKMPMIIFNIPSLVPLVPGGPAYQAVRSFVLGDLTGGVNQMMVVIATAGAIAAGFMATTLVENILKALRRQRT